jgi:hypothetical protein
VNKYGKTKFPTIFQHSNIVQILSPDLQSRHHQIDCKSIALHLKIKAWKCRDNGVSIIDRQESISNISEFRLELGCGGG